MKEYKIAIKKGNGYYDPQLNININSPHGTQKITSEDIINKSVSNLNFAVKTGVVNMTDMDTKDRVIPQEVKDELMNEDEVVVEENNETVEEEAEEEEEDFDEVEQLNMTEEEEEDDSLEEFTEDGQPRCQAITASGNQCSNPAIYPEDDPQYCHISSHQKKYNTDLEDEE